MPHVGWLEAIRVLRDCHPEMTVILPGEKRQIRPGDDVRAIIAPHVSVMRQALDAGVGTWRGYTSESQVRQVRRLLDVYFCFHQGAIDAAALNALIEDLLYVHKGVWHLK